jgi:hypothetical protein
MTLPTLAELEVRKAPQWMSNNGAGCPVLDDMRVMVRYRNGKVAGPYMGRYLRWRPWPGGHECAFDIVAFRLEDGQQ